MALNTTNVLASLGTFLQVFANRADIETETLNFHNDIIRKVIVQVEDFATEQRDTLASKTLSDAGKSQTIAKQSTDGAAKFAFLGRVVSRIEGERDTAKTTLDRVTPSPTLDKEDGREIRSTYTGLSQQERDLVVLRAAEASSVEDPEDPDAQRRATNVLWAMLNAPGFALATPDMQRRALDERGRRLHPALYATWQQSDLLADSLHNLRDNLVGWLRGLGGDPKKIYEALGGDAPPEPSIDKARRMVAA